MGEKRLKEKKNKKKCNFLQEIYKKYLQNENGCSKIFSKVEILRGTLMKISEVRVRLVKKDEGKLKAVASVTIDECFVIHDVKILEGAENYFIAMPSKKTPDGEYKDVVHPLDTETREMFKKAVLEEFEKARAQVALDTQE